MLVVGYGNPSRMDDGLGPAFAEKIAALRLPGVDVSIDYQLSVDHVPALLAANVVVFADALIGSSDPFDFRPVAPSHSGDLTSHALTPQTLLAVAVSVFGAAPKAYILGIAGARFDRIAEGLSPEATRNLAQAVAFFTDWAARPALEADGVR